MMSRVRLESAFTDPTQNSCALYQCLGLSSRALASASSAAAGLFDEAVRWQNEAIARVPEPLQPRLRARLDLYAAGRPYVEGGAAETGPPS